MIGIVDYDAGNLFSVKKAIEYLGANCKLISSEKEFSNIDKLILPGVGAFGCAVDNLKSRGIYNIIINWINEQKPFLGICLGMQILFERSEETPNIKGLGIFEGEVLRFPSNELKIPQIGWNYVHKKKDSQLLKNINDKSYFYFLHGYYVHSSDDTIISGSTEYGVRYTSMVENGNICAVQFHPEKSGDKGLKLLQNWIKLF